MLDKKVVEELLSIAVEAPSGDNSQPWRFEVDLTKGVISLLAVTERDHPILNVYYGGTYIACGAVIQNMAAILDAAGWSYGLDILPQGDDILKPVCTITVRTVGRSDLEILPITSLIKERATNRKPYKKDEISQEVINSVAKKGIVSNSTKISFVSDKEQKKYVTRACAAMDQIALENESLHEVFFGDILWSKEKAEKGEPGLYIETMELPAPVKKLFKSLRSMSFTRRLNKIGFSKFASAGNAKVYAKASHVAAITVDSLTPRSFIETGRRLQDVWISATQEGIALQPITGLPFLYYFWANDSDSTKLNLSDSQVVLLKKSFNTLKESFGVNDSRYITMILRVGYAEKPSARSYRQNAMITFVS